MLDKKSIIVLKALKKYKNDNNYIEGSQKLLSYFPSKFTLNQIEKTLWYLHKIGYIECHAADDGIIGIHINYEAENYSEFNRIELASYIKKNIVTPVFIAFITAIITSFVMIHFKLLK